MTNEEKDLLIAYLFDAGDIDPDGDVEAQFLEWRQVRQGQVSGEAHYKAYPGRRPGAEAEPRERARRDTFPTVRPPGSLRPQHSLRLLRPKGTLPRLAEGYAKRRNDPLGDLAVVRRGPGPPQLAGAGVIIAALVLQRRV